MRRATVRAAAFAALALALACGGPTSSPPALLVGANDLALVRNLVFVTSSDRDELRALELDPVGLPAGTRQFLPAPDPIEPLSIPVAPKPSRLAHDVAFGPRLAASGATLSQGAIDTDAGSYVFANPAGGEAISVVASDRDKLIEVARLTAPAPVTATVAWADPPHALSHLWFTTWDGQRSALYEVQLPLDALQTQQLAYSDLLAREHHVAQLDGEAVVDLALVPGAAPREIDGVRLCNDPLKVCLALATRQMSGRAGRVVLVDLDTLQLATLHFPSPVKKLATFGAAEVGTFSYDGTVHAGWDTSGGCDGADGGCDRRTRSPDGTLDLGAGQRLWGLTDEESCGNTGCAGALAVDTYTGQVPDDLSGLPMLPVNLGDSLLAGLAFQPEGKLLLPSTITGTGVAVVAPLSVLGVITGTSGTIAYFDASILSQLDIDPTGPAVTQATLFDTTPSDIPWADGPKVLDGGTLVLADGVWHADQILITHRGILPGAAGLPTQDSDGLFFSSAGADFSDRVHPGDLLEVTASGGACQLAVDSVSPSGFTADAGPGGLPQECSGRSAFSVRAEGAQPDVVTSTNLGFVLRCGPNQSCESRAQPYFYRPLSFDPLAPTIHIEFGDDVLVDGGEVGQDYTWSLQVDGHFAPYVVGIDPTSVACATQLAGAAVLDPAHERTFVAFPAANGVMEVDQTSTVRGVNQGASVCYR